MSDKKIETNKIETNRASDIAMDKSFIKTKICNVVYWSDSIFINFDGYGLLHKNPKGYKSPQLKVSYDGVIGTPRFKYTILDEGI